MRWALPNFYFSHHIGRADAHEAMSRYCRDRISDHAFSLVAPPVTPDDVVAGARWIDSGREGGGWELLPSPMSAGRTDRYIYVKPIIVGECKRT